MADRRLRRHLSQDEMNRGIGMLHSGLSQGHVANVLGVSQSVVSRMWIRFITTGNHSQLSRTCLIGSLAHQQIDEKLDVNRKSSAVSGVWRTLTACNR